jgi:NAD(P)-dependent dehydrogenase (short-subunit alcohol dehydrogenase family)
MASSSIRIASAVDAALEASIVGSFSRIGFEMRRVSERWEDPPRLDGRTVLVTGASSGIGRAVALGVGRLGAHVILTARDIDRLDLSAKAVVGAGGTASVVPADLVEPSQVEALVERIAATSTVVDAVVHNAGALFPTYRQASDGAELTVATHVLAPFRLTRQISPLMNPQRYVLVTVSSGGMYTEKFDLSRLEMDRSDYRGAVAYARAKRAQVVLAAQWQLRLGPGVLSYSTHPGWVRTAGLDAGLPGMARLGPMLRTPEQGADTIVWLAGEALARPQAPVPGFWHDRRPRGEYYRPGTGRSPLQARSDGEALWSWCEERTRNG